ncbi:MAG TPA: uroporphyrinogen decarboxylase family protein [Anaerolineae bacterium]|nr:uroporphyrinogen decarboxylase family protein [Anaerolineae bacterium]HPL29378.1 uroporphyrinogen decarboxylase family protein [Anaerolineae bacterium]
MAGCDLQWWREFWAENDRCLYGDAAGGDERPVFPAFTTQRPRVPVLIELGEDWIIQRMGVSYRRYIEDFEFQQEVRAACAALLMADIGLHLKPKVDSSSLLHGSVYGNPIEYPEDSTPWLKHIIRSADDIKPLMARMEQVDLAQAGLVPWFAGCYRRLNRPYRWRILHDPTSVHGPGTILSFLCGINDMAFYLYDEPDLMQALLATVGEITVTYSRLLRHLTGAPMSGVGIFDDVAGVLSPQQFERFLLPVYAKIYGELAPGPKDDRFYHNDARVGHLLDMLHRLDVNGINPDPETDPALIRAKLPGAIIYGCVPPLLLRDGQPDEIMAAARRTIERAGEGGGLVLTAAGSINMGTSYANLQALCQAAERYGRYHRGIGL